MQHFCSNAQSPWRPCWPFAALCCVHIDLKLQAGSQMALWKITEPGGLDVCVLWFAEVVCRSALSRLLMSGSCFIKGGRCRCAAGLPGGGSTVSRCVVRYCCSHTWWLHAVPIGGHRQMYILVVPHLPNGSSLRPSVRNR